MEEKKISAAETGACACENGLPITEKEQSAVTGGMVVNCPYCGEPTSDPHEHGKVCPKRDERYDD